MDQILLKTRIIKIFHFVEGLYALKSAKYLSDLYKLDTPIINSIFDYIYNNKSIDKIILNLLNRPIGIEFKN